MNDLSNDWKTASHWVNRWLKEPWGPNEVALIIELKDMTKQQQQCVLDEALGRLESAQAEEPHLEHEELEELCDLLTETTE